MKIVTYTFRTFHSKELLSKYFEHLVILGKLKEDLARLFAEIDQIQPDLIIGFANPVKGQSRIETAAINQFNKTKRISTQGKAKYALFVPLGINIPIGVGPTDSFCNWSMYKIAEYTDANHLDAKLAFIHITKHDLGQWLTNNSLIQLEQ